MDTNQIIKLLSGVIGFFIGSLFLLAHFLYTKRRVRHFTHDNKSETIFGHVKKYFFFMGAMVFYCICITGFVQLIFYT